MQASRKCGNDLSAGIGDDGDVVCRISVFIIADYRANLQGALQIEATGYRANRQFGGIPDELYNFCYRYMEFTGLRVPVYFIVMPLYNVCHGFGCEVIVFAEAPFFIGYGQL